MDNEVSQLIGMPMFFSNLTDMQREVDPSGWTHKLIS